MTKLTAQQYGRNVIVPNLTTAWSQHVQEFLLSEGYHASAGDAQGAIPMNTSGTDWIVTVKDATVDEVQPLLDQFFDTTLGRQLRASEM